MYVKYSFNRYFDSFDHFYTLYQKRNQELWVEYGDGKITKEELNSQRFLYPLGFTNPAKVRLYGYGGRILPESFKKTKIDDLPEIPLWRAMGMFFLCQWCSSLG